MKAKKFIKAKRRDVMSNKIYKEPIKEEMETTINVLYNENKLSLSVASRDNHSKIIEV